MSAKPEYLINWWYPTDFYPVCEVKIYSYTALFLLYKTKAERKVLCLSEEIFYQLLNQWNKDGSDVWKYYAD